MSPHRRTAERSPPAQSSKAQLSTQSPFAVLVVVPINEQRERRSEILRASATVEVLSSPDRPEGSPHPPRGEKDVQTPSGTNSDNGSLSQPPRPHRGRASLRRHLEAA